MYIVQIQCDDHGVSVWHALAAYRLFDDALAASQRATFSEKTKSRVVEHLASPEESEGTVVYEFIYRIQDDPYRSPYDYEDEDYWYDEDDVVLRWQEVGF